MTYFEKIKSEYEELKKKFFENHVSSEVKDILGKVKELYESLERGPNVGGGYLSWTGDLLEEAELRLARYSEFLAIKEAEAEGEYTFYKNRYNVLFSERYKDVKMELQLKEEKITVKDIEATITKELSDLQSRIDIMYEHYKTLRATVDSTQRFMNAITHRIKELQSEKGYRL